MKVVLRKDVPNVGEEDAEVRVSDGYARNYLIPRGLAVLATKKILASAEKRRAEKERQLEEKRAHFEKLAQKISSLTISIPADAGEEGKLFGSVTTQDIALALREQGEVEIDKKKIEISEPIKTLGEHEATVKFFKEIAAKLKVKIIAK